MKNLAPVDVREAAEQLKQEESDVVSLQSARMPFQILSQIRMLLPHGEKKRYFILMKALRLPLNFALRRIQRQTSMTFWYGRCRAT